MGEFSSEEEEVKVEDGSDSITSDPELSLPALTFYRNDKRLPIYSKQNPDIQRFRICLKKDVPVDRLVTRKPVQIKDTATFIVNQNVTNLKHPKDLDADDTPVAYNKKESTRFYELETGEGG